ncbi:hypothetical protein KJA15_00200 [Patescibacteria group bacterium]|nr:hypothetical protein [Patescibacteria group bacterium]
MPEDKEKKNHCMYSHDKIIDFFEYDDENIEKIDFVNKKKVIDLISQ